MDLKALALYSLISGSPALPNASSHSPLHIYNGNVLALPK